MTSYVVGVKRGYRNSIVSSALLVFSMACLCVSGEFGMSFPIVIAAALVGVASLGMLIWAIMRYRRAH